MLIIKPVSYIKINNCKYLPTVSAFDHMWIEWIIKERNAVAIKRTMEKAIPSPATNIIVNTVDNNNNSRGADTDVARPYTTGVLNSFELSLILFFKFLNNCGITIVWSPATLTIFLLEGSSYISRGYMNKIMKYKITRQ